MVETISRQVSVESVTALEGKVLDCETQVSALEGTVLDYDGRVASRAAAESLHSVLDSFHGPRSADQLDEVETFTVNDLASQFKRLSAELQKSLQAHLKNVLRTELTSLMKDMPRLGSRQQTLRTSQSGMQQLQPSSPSQGRPRIESPRFDPVFAIESEFGEDYADTEEIPLIHRGYLARKVYETMAPLQGLETLHDHGFHTQTHRKSQRKSQDYSAHGLHVSRETPTTAACEPPPEEEIPVLELEPLRALGKVTTPCSTMELHEKAPTPHSGSNDSLLKEAWGSDKKLKRTGAGTNAAMSEVTTGHNIDLRAHKVNVKSAPKIRSLSQGFSALFKDKTLLEASRSDFRKLALFIVERTYFNLIAGIAIVSYCVAIGFQTQWLGQNVEEEPPKLFDVTEVVFCIFFALELTIRLAAYQMAFFYGDGYLWNLFDAFLVVTQVIDLILGAVLGDAAERPANISFIRVLRVLRLVRVIRLVRIVRFLSELRSIVGSIMHSIKSLFFTCVIIFFLVFIMGIFLTQLVVEVIRSNDDSDVRHDLRHFATLESSFLVLFQSLTGGVDWGGPLEPLMEHTSPIVGIAYCLYISFGVLCMLNVITGVFVESACNSTQEEKDANMVSRLQHFLCNNTDCSSITWEDFSSRLDDPEIQMYFKTVDLDLSEAQGLFKLLDSDDSGSVEAEEFVLGCLRLRGVAKAVDLATLMYENRRWHKRIDRLTRRVDHVLHGFSAQLSSLCLS